MGANGLKGKPETPDRRDRKSGFGGRPRKTGPFKAITLERSAMHYLERFSASEAGLRSVLLRRIDRAARDGRCDAEEARSWIDPVVEKFKRLGYIDDAAFAETKAVSLRRRGDSARKIRMTLSQKGVGEDLIAQALDAHDREVEGDAEFAAAARLAQRRRLGPMRSEPERSERRDKDMAALARTGFSLDVARRVLDLPDPDALEAAVRGEDID